ncbi:MAG: hypothetical protein RMI85_00830 [Candidatus Korarchaeum sp.]|nr:hypothetical protein [Candidatus Korarchaeum sp.]
MESALAILHAVGGEDKRIIELNEVLSYEVSLLVISTWLQADSTS